jgi:hypothetical protein
MLSKSYYTLIGSLPALPAQFEQVDRVPISRIRLEERLKMLDDEDTQVIEQAGDFLVWDRQPLDRTDDDVVRHYDELMLNVTNRMLREIMRTAMQNRTVMSALRRRRKELGPPMAETDIARHIARNWKHPDFRLSGRFPWIAQVDQLLSSDHPFDVERTVLDVVWRTCQRLVARYSTAPFTFEALILYLVRWEIVYRWTTRDASKGQEKFEQLARDAMGEFAEMYA